MWWQWVLFVVSILADVAGILAIITFIEDYWYTRRWQFNRMGILVGLIAATLAAAYAAFSLGMWVF